MTPSRRGERKIRAWAVVISDYDQEWIHAAYCSWKQARSNASECRGWWPRCKVRTVKCTVTLPGARGRKP